MKIKMLLAFVFSAAVLAGCGSSPKSMTSAGEQYFSSHEVKYANVNLRLATSNESKAVSAGYMSNSQVKEHIYGKVKEFLENESLASTDGLDIDVNLHVSRNYSWGSTDSMASLRYSGTVSVKENELILVDYPVGGEISNNSILGNLKTIFAKNDPSNETKYLDIIANNIVSDLPR